MAIRFRCKQCQEPIEVDEELAEKLARCPFCQTVVTVPGRSEVEIDEVATARPVEPASGGLPPVPAANVPLHVGPRPMTYAQHGAVAYGNYSLIATALFITLTVAMAVILAIELSHIQAGSSQPTQPPSFAEATEMLEDVRNRKPWISALPMGGLFFALIGLVFGIISLSKWVGSWRGWVAVTICGGYLLMSCVGALLTLV